MQSDIKYLHAFASIPSVGTKSLRLLGSRFPNFEEAWRADEGALRQAGIDEKVVTAIAWKRPSLDPDRGMDSLIREGVWMIRESEEAYPALLKEIAHPPYLIYGIGRPTGFSSPLSVAVVGMRKPTSYGTQAAEEMTAVLASAGATIISGLALGIDAVAHKTALDQGAMTIGVLGSGVDHGSIYPSTHRGLAMRIRESGGAVISEYPPTTPALREHFPARNRIISGLSKGVVVIEAEEKSGSLITARFALDQNRDVFAVPGSIFSRSSKGTNALIQEGAKLVSSGEDILKEYGIHYTSGKESDEPIGKEEELLLDALSEMRSVDDLKAITGLDTPVIITSLSLLELKGRIRDVGGASYERIS